jgi:hypothetical protein
MNGRSSDTWLSELGSVGTLRVSELFLIIATRRASRYLYIRTMGRSSGLVSILNHPSHRMSTISLYTTAATTSEADLLLDTHINILPSSPDIIRFQCALRAGSLKHDVHGPIFAGENTLLDVHDALPAYLSRITAIVTQRALGRLVLVKNGSTAWRTHLNGDSRKEDAVEDVQILFHGSGLDSTSNEDRNHLRISDLAAQQWLDKYTIRTAGRSVLEVQDDLRRILIEHSPRKLLGLSSDMHMRPFINRQELHAVIALGGMSECGKSTIGKEVDTLLGEKGRREKFA